MYSKNKGIGFFERLGSSASFRLLDHTKLREFFVKNESTDEKEANVKFSTIIASIMGKSSYAG